eukprot:6243075-Amphidinium_carterae.1
MHGSSRTEFCRLSNKTVDTLEGVQPGLNTEAAYPCKLHSILDTTVDTVLSNCRQLEACRSSSQ